MPALVAATVVPLTLFSGRDQLGLILDPDVELGLGLREAVGRRWPEAARVVTESGPTARPRGPGQGSRRQESPNSCHRYERASAAS